MKTIKEEKMAQMLEKFEQECPHLDTSAPLIEIPGPAFGVLLENPRYPHNVGTAVRMASCFGVPNLWITGERVPLEPSPGYRLPREERMRGYKDVTLEREDDILFNLPKDVVPVCVELGQFHEKLPNFEHPENALYVFGPEDGSLSPRFKDKCHRFVEIPSRHCLNLATAISVVLYDRTMKLMTGMKW
jgi:tRNA(Leu) C34 or U34 (ribose-2'-O)-methylase TrmL